MTSTQAKEFADFLDALRVRFSNPDLDLATQRDIVETMHLAAKEPEGVSYEEVSAGGVEALWCIPADSDPRRCCCTVIWGERSLRRCTPIERLRRTSPARPACGPWCSITAAHRNTNSPPRSTTCAPPMTGCCTTVIEPKTLPALVTRSAATSRSALRWTAR